MKRLHRFLSSMLGRVLVLSTLAALAPACSTKTGTPATPFSVSSASLPNAVVGTPYTQTLTTVSGTAPVTWAILTPLPNLPPGLALAPLTGVISGTPTGSANVTSFTVRATDANGLITDAVLSITVTGGAALGLTVSSPAVLPGGTLNSPYSTGLSASGGTPPYSWSVTAGTLPVGLTLTPSTGVISGIPTTLGGPVGFTVTVTDSVAATAPKPVSITINGVLSASTPALPPSTTTSTTYTQTLTTSGGTGPFAWTVSGGALPTGLALNGATGVISGTISGAPGTYTFTVQVTDTSGATASQSLSIVVNGIPSITTASVPNWTVNHAGYSQTLAASGGTPGYVWTVSAGAPPTGLALSAGGVLAGTPTVAGPYTFTVKVTDAAGVSAIQQYTVTIHAAVGVTTPTLSNWTVNRPGYSQTLAANGGTGALTWSNGAGLPPGLALSAAGVLSGTPTTAGPFTFTVTATDTLGATGSAPFTVTINPVPTVATLALPNWSVGRPFNQTLTVTGGTGTAPFSWTISSGTLPPGLGLSLGGVLSGTPTAPGIFSFTATVTDLAGATAFHTYNNLTITAAVVIATTTLPNWTVNRVGYTQTLTVVAGTGTAPFTWAITGGAQPPGLALSAAGVLSGTPTLAGAYTFTVTVTDGTGATGVQTYTNLTINPVPTVATLVLPNWTVNRAYNQTLAVTAATGTAPFTWAITAGTAPTGLTLSAAGVLGGTPTASNAFTFTATVTDAAGATAGHAYTVTINPVPTVATLVLPNWTVNRVYSQTLAVTAATGTAPFNWTLSAGTAPTGLTLTLAGVLGGTPTAPGPFTFTVTATDQAGATATQTYTNLTINPAPTITTPTTLPDGAVAIAYSLQFTNAGGTPPFTWASAPNPPVAGLTFPAGGLLSGSPTTGGANSFNVTVTDGAGATATVNNFSLFVLAPLGITTVSPLPAGTAGVAYNQTLAATGGRLPYAWSTLSGTLPTGVTLSAAGVLAGTPTVNGNFIFTVRVTDVNNRTSQRTFLIAVTGAAPGAMTISGIPPNGTVGHAYGGGVSANGGTPPYITWSTTLAVPGLAFANGQFTGTPTTAGTFTGTITVHDSAGPPHVFTTPVLTIKINPAIAGIAPANLVAWTINRLGYSRTLTATPAGSGTPPNTFALASGALPTGMTLSPGGVISGTPTVAGAFSFSVQVTDLAGATAPSPKAYSITINPAPQVATASVPAGTQGVAYPGATLRTTVGTGTPPFVWSSVPTPPIAGLVLAPGTGVLGGTPTANGTISVTFTVTDAAGATASAVISLQINAAPAILTPSPLPGAAEGAAYSQGLTASGGTLPLTWSLVGGTLPSGVTLSGATISGTPAAGSAGTYNPQIRVTDSLGAFATRTFSLTVVAGPAVSTTSPLSGAVGVPVDTNLVITFNMSMVKADVEAAFTLATLPFTAVHRYFWDTVATNLNGTILTVVFDTVAPFTKITGDDLLVENTVYTWTISPGAHSQSGLVLPLQTGTFRTVLDATPPGVVSITPDPTTTVLSNPVSAFTIVFTKAMDQSTTTGRTQVQLDNITDTRSAPAGTVTGSLTVQWTNATTLALGLSPALKVNSGYLLKLTQLFDAAGNPMITDLNYTVVTAGTGAVAPTITGTAPENGDTQVSIDSAIFIGLSEVFAPDLPTKITVTGTTTPFLIHYQVGKDQEGYGIRITPLRVWESFAPITVTVAGGAGGATNASGIALAATFSFTFTTSSVGVGANPIVIDAPFSTIKDGATDVDSAGFVGRLFFKDGVTNARIYLNDDPVQMTNSVISVTDPNGIPVKGFIIDAFGSHEPGRSLQIGRLRGPGITPLQAGVTYTMSFNPDPANGLIQDSIGNQLAPTSYTFTVAAAAANRRPQAGIDHTTLISAPGPVRTADLQVSVSDPDLPPDTITVSAADITASNTFARTLSAAGNGFTYSSLGNNEAGFVTSGDVHTLRYTIGDGHAGHGMTIDDLSYIFTNSDLTSLALSPPTAGLTPTYSWSGAVPASVTLLVVTVQDASNTPIYSWVVSSAAISFQQPANTPLVAGTYFWTVGYFHSLDGTIRGYGGQGESTPVTFIR